MQDLPKIGLDLDGVLIDHSESKLRLAADLGMHLERWQTNTNVIRRFLPHDVFRRIQNDIYTSGTPNAPIMPGAIEALRSVKAEFYVVSARRSDSIRHVQSWLCRNRIYDVIPAERIFFCGTGEDKSTHCERLGFRCFLDDNLDVLKMLPRSMDRVLFDADGASARVFPEPWEHTVSGWSDFRRLLLGR